MWSTASENLVKVCCWNRDRSRTKLIFSRFLCLKNVIFVSECSADMCLVSYKNEWTQDCFLSPKGAEPWWNLCDTDTGNERSVGELSLTELWPLKVDQQERDPVHFAFTFYILKEDGVLFWSTSVWMSPQSFCSHYALVSLELRPLLLWIVGNFLLEQDGPCHTCHIHTPVVIC